jgi:hypothetical protein
MLRLLTLVTAGLLIAVPGLLQGIWSGRWSQSQQLEQAVARLERVPVNIGEWKGYSLELERRQVEGTELAGCLVRRYENQRDGRVASVILACGRPGPVAVHSPDVCLPSAGSDLVARPARWSPAMDGAAQPGQPGQSGQAAEFWVATFQKKEATGPLCRRVYWAWSADGTWRAPDSPRLAFARFAVLYKVYLIQEVSRPDEQRTDEECEDFIQLLLPELEKALFAVS